MVQKNNDAADIAASIHFEDIMAARDRISDHIIRTPFLYSQTISDISGAAVWIKFENHQFTASFKERGASNKLQTLSHEEAKAGVIAMSAGNHGQGVAYMAAKLGIPATIVMPETTPFVKVKHTQDFGARVVLSGDTLAMAAETAHQIRDQEGLTFVHPYDDPAIIAGQGTLALEMLEEQPDLDCLMVPVGGGGMISGCAIAAQGIKPNIEIYGVETEMYPGMSNRLAGTDGTMSGVSLAEGIAVKDVGDITSEIIRQRVTDTIIVPESLVENAINLLLTVEKTVAEGAGAAGFAGLLARPDIFEGKQCGVVLCGGNIDQAILASVIMRGLVSDGRLVKIRVQTLDRPGQLARVSDCIGRAGANIVEVQHQRLFLDVSIKKAEVDILIEARDHQHVTNIVQGIKNSGFDVRVVALTTEP